jgi:cholesterol transport system auxiliary component
MTVNKLSVLWLGCVSLILVGCAVKPLVTNQYKLGAYCKKQLSKKPSSHSIFVNTPDAVAGYQREEMLYTSKLFELKPFVHNAWVDQPAEMLLPLIIQSLQHSGYFHVVASSPGAEVTEYRLDTQLLELQQNFLTKPSAIHLVVKVVLVHVENNQVVASRIFGYQIPCLFDTPYGGVLAANRATELFTADLVHFAIRHVKNEAHSTR